MCLLIGPVSRVSDVAHGPLVSLFTGFTYVQVVASRINFVKSTLVSTAMCDDHATDVSYPPPPPITEFPGSTLTTDQYHPLTSLYTSDVN